MLCHGLRNVYHSPHCLATAQFLYQLAGTIYGVLRIMGFQPLLKFTGSIGAQANPFGGFSDIGSIESRSFKQHRMHIIGDFGIFSAHNARNANFLLSIANHQHFPVQFSHLTIQCLELIPIIGTANNNFMSRNGIQIKGMHWLPIFFHHIIGNIHQVVDGANTAGCQPSLHPLGRRSYLNIFADSGAIPGTQILVTHFHTDIIIYVFVISNHLHFRRHKRFSKSCRSLPGNSQHAVAVHPIAGNFIFKHRVMKPQQFHCVRSHFHMAFSVLFRRDLL